MRVGGIQGSKASENLKITDRIYIFLRMNLSSVWTLALFLLLDLYYQQHLSDSLDPLLPPCLKAIIFRRVILRLKHVYSIKYVTGRVALLLFQKNFMNL